MKMLIAALLFVSSSAFAISSDLECSQEILSTYPACSGSGFDVQSHNYFAYLVSKLRSEIQSGSRQTVTLPDVSSRSIMIRETSTKFECELTVDVYDGRCVYAICN